MKLAVQPAGATMQPAALTPGPCTPGHSVLSASSPTAMPVAPALCTCCANPAVYQLGSGRSALAVPAKDRLTAAAHTSAAPQRLRIEMIPLPGELTNLAYGDAPCRCS